MKKTRVLAALVLGTLLSGSASAADSSEFWPDAELFVTLNKRARLYGNAAYAEGKESKSESLDLTAAIDVSLRPIVRRRRQTDDWQRTRMFWTRIGYTRVEKADDGLRQIPEDRLFAQFLAKGALPASVWVEARARAEFRWIDDDYSNRYRFRLEATREFSWRGRPVVPALRAEWFYDSKYDAWSRDLYQLGSEFTLSDRWRVEPYLAYQADRVGDEATLSAICVTAKVYF